MKTFLICYILFITPIGSKVDTAKTNAILFNDLTEIAERVYEIEKTREIDIEVLKVTRQIQTVVDIYSAEPIAVGTIIQTVEEVESLPTLKLESAK